MTKFYRVMYAIFAKPVSAVLRVHAHNLEKLPPDGGCIICANHTSMLDVLVLSAALKKQIRYMAKKELFGIPGLKQLITALGAYPVDRGGADVGSIRRTIKMLGEGEFICVFPQGTRHPGKDPAQTPVKNGVGMIAWHAKATLVPVYIRTKKNRVRFFSRTDVVVGDPIPFDELGMTSGGSAQYAAATERVFADVCALGGSVRALPAAEKAAEGTKAEDAE